MLNNSIIKEEKILNEKIALLDNLYMQIKIHHEREEYSKAFEVYKEVAVAQKEFNAIQEKLRFYKAARRLNREGILIEVVKKGNEALAMG